MYSGRDFNFIFFINTLDYPSVHLTKLATRGQMHRIKLGITSKLIPGDIKKRPRAILGR